MDDYGSQFDLEPPVTTKVKSAKKPGEKFLIKETIYEMDGFDNDDDDDIINDEAETKRYKCCSCPPQQHCSVRCPDLDFEYDDCDFTSDVERTMPVDMPVSHRHTRTYSTSSENDE